MALGQLTKQPTNDASLMVESIINLSIIVKNGRPKVRLHKVVLAEASVRVF